MKDLFVVISEDFHFPKHTVVSVEYDSSADAFKINDCNGEWKYVSDVSPHLRRLSVFSTQDTFVSDNIRRQVKELENLSEDIVMQEEYTGGSTNYYKVWIDNPTSVIEQEPYQAEANDIIEALDMNYAEGNAFKALWRKAAARQGKKKKGYDNGLYDSEKVRFFGERLVVQIKTEQ